eukprot:541123-Rhodomonas_salina.1
MLLPYCGSSGTGVAYGATGRRARYVKSGTEIAYAYYRATRSPRMLLCDVLYWDSVCCYATCCTRIAYAATAMCCTNLGYDAMMLCAVQYGPRLCYYAMYSTDLGYGATRPGSPLQRGERRRRGKERRKRGAYHLGYYLVYHPQYHLCYHLHHCLCYHLHYHLHYDLHYYLCFYPEYATPMLSPTSTPPA